MAERFIKQLNDFPYNAICIYPIPGSKIKSTSSMYKFYHDTFKVDNSREFKGIIKRDVLNSRKEKLHPKRVNFLCRSLWDAEIAGLQKALSALEKAKSSIEDDISELERMTPEDLYKKNLEEDEDEDVKDALNNFKDLSKEENNSQNKKFTYYYNKKMGVLQSRLVLIRDAIELYVTSTNMLERLCNEEVTIEHRAMSDNPMTEDESLAYLEKKLEEMYNYIDSFNFKDE